MHFYDFSKFYNKRMFNSTFINQIVLNISSFFFFFIFLLCNVKGEHVIGHVIFAKIVKIMCIEVRRIRYALTSGKFLWYTTSSSLVTTMLHTWRNYSKENF